jgi:DNA processing protein
MSGLSQATCVIEAGSTSGAKLQARYAYEHGKRVFLLRSLTEAQPWAAKMLADGRAIQIESTDQVIERMADPKRIEEATAGRHQLAMDLFSETA